MIEAAVQHELVMCLREATSNIVEGFEVIPGVPVETEGDKRFLDRKPPYILVQAITTTRDQQVEITGFTDVSDAQDGSKFEVKFLMAKLTIDMRLDLRTRTKKERRQLFEPIEEVLQGFEVITQPEDGTEVCIPKMGRQGLELKLSEYHDEPVRYVWNTGTTNDQTSAVSGFADRAYDVTAYTCQVRYVTVNGRRYALDPTILDDPSLLC